MRKSFKQVKSSYPKRTSSPIKKGYMQKSLAKNMKRITKTQKGK